MRTLLLLLASAAISTSTASAATPEALWRCTGPDGNEIFTNQKQERLKDCEKYEIQSDKNEVRSVPKRSDAELKIEASPSSPVIAQESRTAEPQATGLIDFTTFNRLTLGMTQAEVLNVAGPPKTKLADSWVYALADASMVEIRFGTGRIVEIRSHQSPQ